jgi:hypothetical protein
VPSGIRQASPSGLPSKTIVSSASHQNGAPVLIAPVTANTAALKPASTSTGSAWWKLSA